MSKTFLSKLLPEGSMIRNVSMLVFGAGAGQFAMVLALPLLTRLYTSEEYGVLAIYTGLLSIISVISGFRYELAIPLAKTNEGAVNILTLSILCVCLSSAILVLLIVSFSEEISLWLNVPTIGGFLWLLPVGVFFSGVYQSFNYWAVRNNSFDLIARTKTLQGVGGAVTQILLGLLHLGPLGLIVGGIVSQCGGLFTLIKGAHSTGMRQLVMSLKWFRVKYAARKYGRFPKYTVWSALANVVSNMLPLILFAGLFSPEIAGIFFLAYRAVQLPLSLIGNGVSQAFYSKISSVEKKEDIKGAVIKLFCALMMISTVPFVIIVLCAPDFFSLVFGGSWRVSGMYVQYLVPWFFLQFCVSCVSQVALVMGKQKGLLVSQLIFLVVRVGVILLGSQVGMSAQELIACFSLASAFLYIGHFLWICSFLDARLEEFLSAIGFYIKFCGKWIERVY